MWRTKDQDYTNFSTGKTPYAMLSKTDYVVEHNAAGQTLGSLYDATIAGEEPPDLIKAYGKNGKEGFVYYADMMAASPSSPEEALQQRGTRATLLPVYLEDGITEIDKFEFVREC